MQEMQKQNKTKQKAHVLKRIKNIKHAAYVAIVMYCCLKFNSLSAADVVCLLFILILVWRMNLAHRISLPSLCWVCKVPSRGSFTTDAEGSPSIDSVHNGSPNLSIFNSLLRVISALPQITTHVGALWKDRLMLQHGLPNVT